MYNRFRFAGLDKPMHRFLLAALATLAVLAVTPAFAASDPGGEMDWWNMGMKLLGGLALFLYGMEQMADSLKAVAGERMKTILAKLTTNRFMGAATGAFVTAIIQSSSVTTVLVVGFITAGLMNILTGLVFRQPIPVQPMKAIAAIAIAEGLLRDEIIAAGLWMLVRPFFRASGRDEMVEKEMDEIEEEVVEL